MKQDKSARLAPAPVFAHTAHLRALLPSCAPSARHGSALSEREVSICEQMITLARTYFAREACKE
jgi:hypothetical protein